MNFPLTRSLHLGALPCIFLTLVAATPPQIEPLDQANVRKLYNDGDFEGVIHTLSVFRDNHATYSRDDSVFIAKHLAVVYAADPKSVGQGKYWMNELLKVMPAADFVGMYVSEEIDRVFENVRREFLTRQHAFGVDTASLKLPNRPGSLSPEAGATAASRVSVPKSDPKTEPSATLRTTSNSTTWWMIGGVSVLTVAGLTTYVMLRDKENHAPEEYIVPTTSPSSGNPQ